MCSLIILYYYGTFSTTGTLNLIKNLSKIKKIYYFRSLGIGKGYTINHQSDKQPFQMYLGRCEGIGRDSSLTRDLIFGTLI